MIAVTLFPSSLKIHLVGSLHLTRVPVVDYKSNRRFEAMLKWVRPTHAVVMEDASKVLGA